MNASIRLAAIATACSVLAIIGNPGVGAEPAPTPREIGNKQLPERVFSAIVKESVGFLEAALPKNPSPGVAVSNLRESTIRGNALVIALAAQNRLQGNVSGAEAAKLATLRDAAIRLTVAIKKSPTDRPEVRKEIEILSRFPDIQPDANANPASVRLTDTFDHEDVATDFGGCSGNKTQRLERSMILFIQQKKPFTSEELAQVELLAYKFALIGEIFPDLYDFVPHNVINNADLRKQWNGLAGEVHLKSWELTESVRTGQEASIRAALKNLDNTCVNCHDKFRQ